MFASVEGTGVLGGSDLVVGVDAASWSREAWELETLKNLMADTLAVAGVDHRREQDDDGNAGREEVARVALQLVVTTSAHTQTESKVSGQRKGHDSLQGLSTCFSTSHLPSRTRERRAAN